VDEPASAGSAERSGHIRASHVQETAAGGLHTKSQARNVGGSNRYCGRAHIQHDLGTDFSKAFARINRPMLFAYEPALQPNADFRKAKLGDKVRLERFDGDGHALFVDDPVKFNRVVKEFIHSLPKQ
jgi:pimeloyl-ACP methyl ester carboxylesterase